MSASEQPTDRPSTDAPANERPFTREAALATLGAGADAAFLAALAGLIRDTAPPLLEQLAGAIGRRDFERIAAQAHAIKGSVAAVGAVRAASIAQTIEDLGRSRRTDHAEGLLAALRAECDAIVAALG